MPRAHACTAFTNLATGPHVLVWALGHDLHALGAEAPHWQINIVRHAHAQVLGREVGTIYTRSELKHLIGIHVENPEHRNESGLTREDHQMLSGVLDYRVRAALRVLLQGSSAWLCMQAAAHPGALGCG